VPREYHVRVGYHSHRGSATVEEFWEEMFSMRSAGTVMSYYNKVTARFDFCAVRAEAL
jgi:hypothetical protein